MSSAPSRFDTRSASRRVQLITAAVILALAVSFVVFEFTRKQSLERLQERTTATALSHAQALGSVLATQRAVGAILSDDALVKSALLTPRADLFEDVSRKLERLRVQTAGNVIYLLDTQGVAQASSNWQDPLSFVGGDFSFRAYFHDAIEKGMALQYALGTISDKAGLYLSHDIRAGEQLLGVIIVKIDFDALESIWSDRSDLTQVRDETGQVLITSAPRGDLARHGQHIEVVAPVPGGEGWQLQITSSSVHTVQGGLAAGGATLAAFSLLGWLAARAGRSRRDAQARTLAEQRYREDLELAVSARTRALTAEVTERRAAEASLARMQADLVQANKLATLGQVTAGLAHEVNQPVATIRLLAENAVSLMPVAPEEVGKNLDKIIRMADRIGQITTHLRGFSRKATGEIGAVEVREIIDASLLLTASRRRHESAHLRIEGARKGIRIRGEAVRLEQILVNLIQNAQEALTGMPDPRITIAVSADTETVTLMVSDNGPGISPDIEAQIFMPFATSKRDGVGLGLVIAREIARGLGGDLTLAPEDTDTPHAGATFLLQLVRA